MYLYKSIRRWSPIINPNERILFKSVKWIIWLVNLSKTETYLLSGPKPDKNNGIFFPQEVAHFCDD